MVLIIIIFYIYAVIGFFYFQDMFWEYGVNPYDSDVIGESTCADMWQCFLTIANLGIRNGGGIGEHTIPESYVHNKSKYFAKLLYTSSYHIIVLVILLNICFGIIIDTFAQLRDAKTVRDDDMTNVCYICSLNKSTFDKEGEGFENHIEKDHNIWYYIYYIVHLRQKDQTEYTGVESQVWERYNNDDIAWFPLHKAMILDSSGDIDGEDEAANNGKLLEEVNSRMKVFGKELKKVQK